MHMDQGFYIFSSSLINENKLLIFSQKDSTYLLLNLDMKVYWRVSSHLQSFLEDHSAHDSTNPHTYFFIPDSSHDAAICLKNRRLLLAHSSLQQSTYLSNSIPSTTSSPDTKIFYRAYKPKSSGGTPSKI